jgi:hypothetical protein
MNIAPDALEHFPPGLADARQPGREGIHDAVRVAKREGAQEHVHVVETRRARDCR